MINKYQLVTKKKWRLYVIENKKKCKMLPNEERLFVNELSIEATHQILMFYTHELYYSFQLLDVIQRFPSLTDVLKAVTSNAE